MRWQQYAIAAIVGCGTSVKVKRPIVMRSPTPIMQASEYRPIVIPHAITEVTCPDVIVRFENGVERGRGCASEIRAPLVLVELADAWAPRLFAPGPDGVAPDYRRTYLELATERDAKGKPLEPNEALGELYGVLPSLAIVRARFADEARHACHAAIDSSSIKSIDRPYGQDSGAVVRANDWTRSWLGAQLERERVRRKLPDLAALAAIPKFGPLYARWKKLDELHAGIIAVQRHLVCEGFLEDRYVDGSITWRTGMALEMFQRRNFLMPNNRIDPETRDAIATDSRELDFRFALRVLRERVVDATGLIEDGTAGAGPQPILGRMLDPRPMQAARGHKPLANAAPDLVSAATEAAARQLGWTGPAETAAFLERHATGPRVAIELPPVPAYHAPHMELSAEVDRGDIYYDTIPIVRTVQRRPNLVLYVNDAGTKRPLMRWPTTIGGWADVLLPGGGVVQKWKESDVGPRVWRDVYAAPTWIPPPTTPDRDLVKNLYNGKWDLKRSIMGPGPRAAFGIVLLPHLYVAKVNGVERFYDHGIGTHGSASVTSIVNGNSHGCHRLYNQLAVRLANFLLSHRTHAVKGQQKEYWRRRVQYRGSFMASIDTRGFLYQLNPPVPVTVTKGNIKTPRKTPPLAAAPARP